MTEFIERLTKEEESELLSELGYFPYDNDCFKGNKKYKYDGSMIYHTWNHDYSNKKDYDEEYLEVNDYYARFLGLRNREETNIILYEFMFKKFDKEWANKAIKFFKGKKATAKVRFIETLIEISKIEAQEL